MKYIESVESTLKGGCKVQLGPKTVIFGPNGSGKSTIVQSIELATRGCVSDMEGRDQVRQVQSLARLFPSTGGKTAVCELSTGDSFSWELCQGASPGSYKKPIHSVPVSVAWPVQDLMSTLGKDSASVQAWLEEQVFAELSEDEALSKLPPAVRPTAKALMQRKNRTDLLGLSKAARTEAKSLRAQATRTEKTIAVLVEGVDPPLTAEARVKLEAELEAAQGADLVTQAEYDYAQKSLHVLAEQIANFQNAIEKEPGSHLTGKVESLRCIKAALSMMEQHVKAFGSPTELCWVCGSKGEKDHEADLREALAVLAEAAAYEDRCILAKSRCVSLEADLTREAEVFKRLKVGSSQAKQDLMKRLVEDTTARKAWSNAEAARQEIVQLRARADLLTATAKSLSSVGKGLLNKAKSDLEGQINAFLPKSDHIGIDLDKARIGIERNGQLHSALSGAEWNRVLLALASTLESSSTLNVLVPEDRGWDCDTLERMMAALAPSNAQIIVMSTVKPNPIEGWTLIDLTS